MLSRQHRCSSGEADPKEEFPPYSLCRRRTNYSEAFQGQNERRPSYSSSASTRRRRLLPACPQLSQPSSWSSADYDDRATSGNRFDYDQTPRLASMSDSPRRSRVSSLTSSASPPPIVPNFGAEQLPARHVVSEAQGPPERKCSMIKQQSPSLDRKFSERRRASRKRNGIEEQRLVRKYSETVSMRQRRLVDKVDRMKRMAVGDGVNDCLVCGADFGVFGPRGHATLCQDCRKYVCNKNCGLEISDGENRLIFVCRICEEKREAWKKSGAWFYHGVPKHVLPSRRRPIYDDENCEDDRAGSAGPSSSSRVSITSSPNRRHNESESGLRARQRTLESPARGPPLSTPEEERDCAPSIPQPRWASAEAEDRRLRELRASRRSVPGNDRYYSSSEDEEEVQSKESRWTSRDARQVTNESNESYSEHSEEEEPVGGSDHSSAGNVRTPPASPRQSPTGTLDNAATDGSDVKSVDSGVVRGEQSPVTRPTSLLPSTPSSGNNGNQNVPQSMQPVAPTFRKQSHIKDTQLNVGSVVAASRRASVAAVERLEKMAVADEGGSSPSGRTDHRLSLTCVSDMASGLFPLTPDLPSSPEDEQSSMGSLEFSLLYSAEDQTLTIMVIKAQNLRSMDKNGYSDPYVKTHLLPGAAKSTKLRTRTINKTLNPEWHENLVYYGITDDDRLKKTLRLIVLDEDTIGADFLGETRVPLKRVTPGKEKMFSVYLERQLPVDKNDVQPEGRGKILLSLTYDNEKQCLAVEVVRCAELVGMDPNGYSDPYVKIALIPESDKKQRAKTRTKKKTLNPVFNETLLLPVALTDLAKKTLTVSVWDKDVGKHDDYLGGVQLGIDSKGDRLKHWYDCIKNPGNSFKKWHKLNAEQFPHSTSTTTA